MSITQFIVDIATHFIASTGYIGVAGLMVLESMIVPIPSEAVMPFAGFLISSGSFTFPGVVIASTIGSIIGSLISYAMGFYGGNKLVKRFGKYLLLNEEHLIATEKFFQKYGGKTVFIGRFIPIVRHFISIPAGIARMKLPLFLLATVIGAGMWNSFLTYIGFVLKNNWEVVHHYGKIIDIFIIILIIAAIVWVIYKYFKKHQTTKSNP